MSSNNRIYNQDTNELVKSIYADLVYIDPPYFNNGTPISYHSRYHFLEGLMHYNDIEENINREKANLEIGLNCESEFEDKASF